LSLASPPTPRLPPPPDYYCHGAGGAGMIVPKTKDGRVVFMLPWEGRVIAGTTDEPIEVRLV
jgi:glycerol-3-phosphate dehydrogenase